MAGDEELTIDQLARRTGMTARNVRAHQSRGLLAPPTLRGRTGYYGPDHVARVKLIQELQEDGYSLDLIKRILRRAGGSTDEVRRFAKALHKPFDEIPNVTDQAEVQEELAELGVPVEHIVAAGEDIRKHTDAIARIALRLFIDHVWRPFDEAGRPEEGLDRILDAIERLRPLASGTFVSMFQVSMQEAAEKGTARELRLLEAERRAS